jgi:hypothetical protein
LLLYWYEKKKTEDGKKRVAYVDNNCVC